MRRRLLPLLLAMTVVAACGDADTDTADETPATTAPTTTAPATTTEAPAPTTVPEPTTTTTTEATAPTTTTPESAPPLDELPRMLVADRETISLIDGSGADEELLTVGRPARIAHAVDESLVVVETVITRDQRIVTAYGFGSADIFSSLGPNPRLHDVVDVDGVPSLLATKDLGDGAADLVLIDLERTETFVTPAADVEFSVVQASVAAGRYSIAAYADLTEIVQVARLDDPDVVLPNSPTDDLTYNAPPLIIYADLSDDGQLLAHVEGPDFDGATNGLLPAPWEVVVSDLATGEERFRAPVTEVDDGVEVTWVDFDGRWLLVSRGLSGEEVELDPVPALLFDLLAPDAGPVTVPLAGTATLLAAG